MVRKTVVGWGIRLFSVMVIIAAMACFFML